MIALLADIPGIDSIEQVGFWGALFSAIIYGGYRAWDKIKDLKARKDVAKSANGNLPPQELPPQHAKVSDVFVATRVNKVRLDRVDEKLEGLSVDMREVKKHMEQEEVDREEIKDFMKRIDAAVGAKQE